MDNTDSRELFDFATFDFPEVLLSTLARDRRFPAWGKCVSLGFCLYGVGAVSTIASGTFYGYIEDPAFLTASIILGVTLAVLVTSLRKIDAALIYSNRRLDRASVHKARFEEFLSWVRSWQPMGNSFIEKPPFWYYLDTLGGALLGSLLGLYWIYYSQTIWWGVSKFVVSSTFFVAWCAVIGYVTGASVFVLMGAIKALREYCKRFVSPKNIVALNPDRVGGLKPFGQISLNVDIALSLPSTVIFVYLGIGVPISNPGVWPLLALYTVVLVVVFFVPISPAHDAMVAAKELAFEEVNDMFLHIHSAMSRKNEKFDAADIANLNDVHLLYERVSKMAVWPLDLSIIVKFLATVLYPFLGSLLVMYLARLLGV